MSDTASIEVYIVRLLGVYMPANFINSQGKQYLG